MQKNTFDKIHHPFRKKKSLNKLGIERMFHDVGRKVMHDRSVVNTILSRVKLKTLLLISTQAVMLALSTCVQYIAGNLNQRN